MASITPEFDFSRAFRSLVEMNFEQASNNFKVNPDTDNWTRLQEAMWAHQFIHQSFGMDWALANLEEVGIGHWVSAMAKEAQGPAKKARS